MSRASSLPAKPTRHYIRKVAVAAEADPRTVEREIAAQRGKGAPVRGMVGDRIRKALLSVEP